MNKCYECGREDRTNIAIFTFVMFILLLIVSNIVNHISTIESMEQKAIKANIAHYELNPKNGKNELVYCCPIHMKE